MTQPQQLSLPFAKVQGELIIEPPKGLYIPPNALKVLLTDFEGPLDLLSFLIRKNKFDIRDIPVFEIALQYQQYIDLMQRLDIELAGEYLFMAAWLTEIKSRMLLPKPPQDDEQIEESDDPRAELMQKLLEYEAYQQGAHWLDSLKIVGRDLWPVQIEVEPPPGVSPSISIDALFIAMQQVFERAQMKTAHQVSEEPIEISDKIEWLMQHITDQPKSLIEFLVLSEGKPGLVVTFIAMLELLRQQRIALEQVDAYQPILITRAA
ncbi:segregation/condensation protein A [Thiomicrospira microaerophila]|uniref:segregation and condensation protein A n=1 Tax=Thiomicrospira microaerophila TaxID=406020 RepID=UPI00200BBB2D|nr:segregation/condensation protein A [Thiomicrospira microaerophila]UQB43394.1 segregation/condensation protein A [Thiomicrospira microaerophila]